VKRRVLAAAILAAIPLAVATATPTVGVNLKVPPPGRYSAEDLWYVELDNQTQNTYTCYLHGEIWEAGRGLAFKANSRDFQLPPGLMKRRGRQDVDPLRDEWHTDGYESFAARTGGLPQGNYTFIVLLEPNLGGDTIKFEVKPTGPPRLILPADGDTVTEKYPLFVWTPPTPPPSEKVTYDLSVFEVRQGQTKEEARVRNKPWYEEKGHVTASLAYPSSAPNLTVGKNYCWYVLARVRGEAEAQSSVAWSFSVAARPAGEWWWPKPYTWGVPEKTPDWLLSPSRDPVLRSVCDVGNLRCVFAADTVGRLGSCCVIFNSGRWAASFYETYLSTGDLALLADLSGVELKSQREGPYHSWSFPADLAVKAGSADLILVSGPVRDTIVIRLQLGQSYIECPAAAMLPDGAMSFTGSMDAMYGLLQNQLSEGNGFRRAWQGVGATQSEARELQRLWSLPEWTLQEDIKDKPHYLSAADMRRAFRGPCPTRPPITQSQMQELTVSADDVKACLTAIGVADGGTGPAGSAVVGVVNAIILIALAIVEK